MAPGAALGGPVSTYAHLGVYSDLVDAAAGPAAWAARPAPETVRRVVDEVLVAASPRPANRGDQPLDVRVERRWQADGLDGEELSWSVGYGPRTRAWLLKPAGAAGPLPGVLALHDHGGFKYYGKEKIADGPEPTRPELVELRQGGYGGRAYANDLAREGYVVLVPDVFGWGSRRFPLEEMPEIIRRLGEQAAPPPHGPVPEAVARYNAAASHHEHLVEKYCTLLGTSFAAVVGYEDRLALRYLLGRPDVTDRVGSIGLSGGGCRSVLLRATAPQLTAAVVVGMMGTYGSLLDHNIVGHTWMVMPAGLGGRVDWPDVAAVAAPEPLLVQYNRQDPLFPLAGAEAADERIRAHYAAAGGPEAYTAGWYDGPHKLDRAMQRDAFDWLGAHLR